MLFFKYDYLILTQHKKHTLKIYFEKLTEKGNFTLLINHSNPTSYLKANRVGKCNIAVTVR